MDKSTTVVASENNVETCANSHVEVNHEPIVIKKEVVDDEDFDSITGTDISTRQAFCTHRRALTVKEFLL